MRKTLLLLLLGFQLTSMGQQIHFEVRFSKPLAAFEFLQKLSQKVPDNVFKKIFTASAFNQMPYTGLVAQFDSIPIDYTYDFSGYPPGQKIGFATTAILKKNMIETQSLQDFKLRSLGLLPTSELNSLVYIMEEFTPVYDRLIYDSAKAGFEKQLGDIKSFINTKKAADYFEQARAFYNSSWDSSIPLILTFYPFPNSKGYTATAFCNIAESAIPASLTDYDGLLTVLLHEASHLLFDEESATIKNEIDRWFTENPSKYSRYAMGLLNESWATAVANGYFHEMLTGSLNTGNWYGRKYVSQMAKQIYPDIKRYLIDRKPLDQSLINVYIKTYEDHFSDWTRDIDYLLTGRNVISDDPADMDTLGILYPYRSAQMHYDFNQKTLAEVSKENGTKFIIITKNKADKLKMIKTAFPELKNWQPDLQTDFTYAKFLANRWYIVIINLAHKDLREQLKAPITS